MADAPLYIQTLALAAFRAYLHPKAFNFNKKRCLAVFAPNGNGKSSLIDALEFVLSKDGTLERLGLRTANNKAGFAALAHNLADDAKIVPTVLIDVVEGKTVTSGKRPAWGSKRPIPAPAVMLNDNFVVNPIIRGHALRSFVEFHTPEQRYADVANWLQLGPLVEVQKNLRALRSQVKAAAEDDSGLRRVDTQLSKETAQVVVQWDSAIVLSYANEGIIAQLDPALVLTSLIETDAAYVELKARCNTEETRIGLMGLRQIRNAAGALWSEETDPETAEMTVSGAISRFDEAIATLTAAKAKEAEERNKAASAAFKAVWEAAEPIFAAGSMSPETCPICLTPIESTTAGSGDAIRDHLAKHLAELADYAAAKKALDNAKAAAAQAHVDVASALSNLIGLLDETADARSDLISYQTAIAEWTQETTLNSNNAVATIAALLDTTQQAIAEIEAKQGDRTYAKAKAKIDRLIELQEERDADLRHQLELDKLSIEMTAQATIIACEIRKKVQAQLDRLQAPMNEIYRIIQGANAAPIRLELPLEEDTNQQRLNLLIDFAKNRMGVQPGGYLSDSQIHSMALALRLTAIKLFNSGAPILALDDVVTSYDADHRRTIAGLIASMFDDCQIILTTHDERFFNYLKDQLDVKAWHFTRIIGLDPTFGPRFADHKITDEMIEERWADGRSAANEMRQAEEEWLLRICRDFGVSVRIRPLEKAYSYERSELASALARFLNDAKLQPPPVPGVSNRFLVSLQKGEIENFGSHFQEGPYGDGSIGDEQARWEEFKAFRDQFSCGKCGRIKFKRPFSLKKPVCAHDGCEAQFEFAYVSSGSARA